MAGLCKSGKKWFIKLSENEDKKRPKIHIGEMREKDAYKVLHYIDDLIASKKGLDLPQDTRDWVNALPDGLRDRLQHIGLVEAVERKRWTVPAWVDHFVKVHTKEGTDNRRKISNVGERLKVFFKGDLLPAVTTEQAKLFRRYLSDTVELSENTVRRHVGICRQIFNGAIDAGLIAKNPFLGQPVTVQPNPSRFFYVTTELSQMVLDAMPDAAWRLIFGLARWGGLRCPSEVVALRWEDVDFDNGRFIVHSPKTAHHIGHEQRTVPMFPELKPLFQDAYDKAPEGAVYCVNRYKGGKEVNLREQFERILKRSKIAVWQKPFQNCRSTRESELFRITNGNIKAVCSWIGNSPEIALKHYAQLQESDLKQAAVSVVLGQGEKKVETEVLNKVLEVPEKVLNGTVQSGIDVYQEKKGAAINPYNCNTLHADTQQYTFKTNFVQWAEVDSNHRRR